MACTNIKNNLKKCNCSYHGCPRKGICCECLEYHKIKSQLPACYFASEVEKEYDRSIKRFIEIKQK
jgi:hypothetical protein